MKNQSVIYTKGQTIAWLERVRPDIPWRDHLEDVLPPLVHRSHWPRLAERYGLPFSRGHLANMDAQGKGPKQIDEALKASRET